MFIISIFKCNERATLVKGDYLPAMLYRNNKKIAGYSLAPFSGKQIVINGTYNDKPEQILINGGFIPSKNLFDSSLIFEYAAKDNISLDGGTLILTDYACSTNITPEMFLELTGLSEGDKVTAFLTKEIISGSSASATGRIAFNPKASSSVSMYALTINGAKRTSTIPQNFNSENYGNLTIYGCNYASPGELRISNIMITKDSQAAYEPYKEPEFPVLYWNDEEIEIPYILCEGDTILCANNSVRLLKDSENTDITKTQFGEKILSLKTLPKTTTVSLSEGYLDITAKIAD